ncbi:MAG: large-conductance mechanosensitive channel protein MscL [Clostridia bacterium]|nr:large-conductance mechanosensitive channel protein MscL [Clostridia bacterium]
MSKLKEKSTGFFKDFKAFISRGNVVDMAVGVIIGGAFGKIVTSLVNDIIMPAVGLLFGKVNFTELKCVFEEAVLDESGAVVTPESALLYGNFIQQIVDFLIIAFCIFVMVRIINGMRRKSIAAERAAAEEAAAKAKEAEEAAAAVVAERDRTQVEILETLKAIEKNLKK